MGVQLINANDFMDAFVSRLKAEGLVLASASELEAAKQLRLRERQRVLMRRKAISFADAVDAQLVSVKTRSGLVEWVKSGKLTEMVDCYQEPKGKKQWMILTAAVRRLGYTE